MVIGQNIKNKFKITSGTSRTANDYSSLRHCTYEKFHRILCKHTFCVCTEYDEIFRTYSDVGCETVRGYDVRLRHYPRHFRILSLEALQNNRQEAKLFGFELCERYFRQLLTSKI